MEQVSRLITQKLKTMTEAGDHKSLTSKRGAISALLPYAVRQERGGQPEMFDTIIRAAGASRSSLFNPRFSQSVSIVFSGANPRAITLVSPHIPWYQRENESALQWEAAVSAVPHTEEVVQSVVETLLQLASVRRPSQHITRAIWTWLTKQPSLPPVCSGRDAGTSTCVVKAVRALKDVDILKSYLLLVWSEWNDIFSVGPHDMSRHSLAYVHGTTSNCPFSSSTSSLYRPNTSDTISCSFCLMQISIQEDFGGVEMGHHRADLIHHLDRVLAQLDRGPEYLKQHDPETDAGAPPRRRNQYKILREMLLETNTKAISCTPHLLAMRLRLLTPTPGARSIPHSIYVRTPSFMSIILRLERSMLPFPALFIPLLRYSLS